MSHQLERELFAFSSLCGFQQCGDNKLESKRWQNKQMNKQTMPASFFAETRWREVNCTRERNLIKVDAGGMTEQASGLMFPGISIRVFADFKLTNGREVCLLWSGLDAPFGMKKWEKLLTNRKLISSVTLLRKNLEEVYVFLSVSSSLKTNWVQLQDSR